MFTTIKKMIPEPRQAADQPRHYTGRHRRPEPVPLATPFSPTPVATAEPDETTKAATV